MKRFRVLLSGVAVLALCAGPAMAVPVFKTTFEEHYNLKAPATDAEKALAASIAEAKCNLCHKGTSKKERNAYGEELHKYLEKDNFKKERVEAEGDKVKAEIVEALKKAEAAKGADGKTFGELIKAGKLPAVP